VDGQDAPIKNPNYQRNPIAQNPVVHDNANPMSANDNGNIHPLSFTSSTPVPSMADANGRSSEYHPSLLEEGRVVTDEDEANERRQYDNALHLVNYRLKELSTMLKLQRPLTMYVARHSWASAAKAKNVPLSVISEGIGHDSEATTQIYLASLETSVVDKANKMILGLL